MFILNVYSRDCVSGFPRHIGTTVGAIRRPYFPFVSFFFSTTIAYSIQLLHWKYFQEFTFLCRHFSSNIRAKRKKLNSEVRKINSLPDSQLALVVLLNWSMPVSMVNVHYSHWNLLSAANERGKEKKREKIEFYVFAYRISKCTEINCIFFSRRTHSQFNQPYLLLTSDALIFNEFSCSHFEAICSVSTVFCWMVFVSSNSVSS